MSVNETVSRRPTDQILQEVATVKGTDPVDLHPPLFDVVDGDLLDSLLESNRDSPLGQSLEVTFRYLGCLVTVTAGGTVDVHLE